MLGEEMPGPFASLRHVCAPGGIEKYHGFGGHRAAFGRSER